MRSRRVLLIEDDFNVREMLGMILQREEYEVFDAENGEEGIRALLEFKPDVILCDLMMPVMGGKDFLRQVRGGHSRHIPILILTAADSEKNRNEVMELGASGFISKGVATREMLTRIKELMETG